MTRRASRGVAGAPSSVEEGLFEEPERIDWSRVDRVRVQMPWGEEPAAFLGTATEDGFPMARVQLDGCEPIVVSIARVQPR